MTESLPSFGDLIRAFARLRPTDAASKRAIANALGFDYIEEAPAPPPPPVEPVVIPAVVGGAEAGPQATASQRRESAPPLSPSGSPFNTDLTPAVLRPLPNAAQAPNWGTAEPLAPPPATKAEPPRLEPLLVPRWTRGILSAALGRRAPEGEIDVEAVVRTISAAQPFRVVPRRLVPRFGRGVQVLVDAGDAMTPFTEDQTWLAERIRVVGGRDRTEVLGIEYAEGFVAGDGMRLEWTDYFAKYVPVPGIVTILISDLGIGRAPLARWTPPAQWLAFAGALQRRGVPLVAIVPYGRSRWPAALKKAIPIVQWDARTTARTARRAIELRLMRGGRSAS
jgi:hypothetical protein